MQKGVLAKFKGIISLQMKNLNEVLNPNLVRLAPDPIRNEIAELNKRGFDPKQYPERDFTIGVPAPLPEDIAKISAEAALKFELTRPYESPPFMGHEQLLEQIIRLEIAKKTGLGFEDKERMGITLGASAALEYVFSLFGPNRIILVQSPVWGTTYNFIADSGNIGLPEAIFDEKGNFNKRSIGNFHSKYSPAAVYINLLGNPNPVVPSPRGFEDFLEFVKDTGWIIVSDDPYIFTMFDQEKISSYSILNSSEKVKARSIKIGSFSKVTKPADRLGYVVIGKELAETMGNGWKMRLRNYGAGTPSVVQASVSAILEHDSNLNFLKANIERYQENIRTATDFLAELGCEVSGRRPDGAYFVFVKAPNQMDGKQFAYLLAEKAGLGFIPGSSFVPSEKHYLATEFQGQYGEIIGPHKDVLMHVRVGLGGKATPENIEKAFKHAIKIMN